MVFFLLLLFTSTPNNRLNKLASRLRCCCRSSGIFEASILLLIFQDIQVAVSLTELSNENIVRQNAYFAIDCHSYRCHSLGFFFLSSDWRQITIFERVDHLGSNFSCGGTLLVNNARLWFTSRETICAFYHLVTSMCNTNVKYFFL